MNETTINIDSASIEFCLNAYLKPWDRDDPEAYSQEIVGRILTHTEQDEEVSLGKVRMFMLNLSDAIHDEAELAFVFDAAALDELWAALFAGDDSDPDVAVHFPGKGILFLDRVNVEPGYEPDAHAAPGVGSPGEGGHQRQAERRAGRAGGEPALIVPVVNVRVASGPLLLGPEALAGGNRSLWNRWSSEFSYPFQPS